jgi:hypothetical protein
MRCPHLRCPITWLASAPSRSAGAPGSTRASSAELSGRSTSCVTAAISAGPALKLQGFCRLTSCCWGETQTQAAQQAHKQQQKQQDRSVKGVQQMSGCMGCYKGAFIAFVLTDCTFTIMQQLSYEWTAK